MLKATRISPPETIGEHGLAIFRPVPERTVFELYNQLNAKLCQSKLEGRVILRGAGTRAPHAASLVELNELRDNAAFRNVPREEAIENLYTNVESLRCARIAPIVGSALLGRGVFRSVVALELESGWIEQERAETVATLRGLTDYEESDDIGIRQKWTPHISVLKVKSGSTQDQKDHIVGIVEEVAPSSLRLKQATFHKP